MIENLNNKNHPISKNNPELESDEYVKWKTSNNQKFLEIHAPNYYELGYLQGEYLYDEIVSLKNLIYLFSLRYLHKGRNYDKLMKSAKIYERFIPKYLRTEMQGIADAILEINYEDILLQNCFMDLLYGQIIPKRSKKFFLIPLEFGCTSIGILNNHYPLIAQNFDYSLLFKPSMTFIHLITPNLTHIFSLKIGSLLSLPVGLNNFGFSLRVNVVKTRKKGIVAMPSSILSRLALEWSQNIHNFYNLQQIYGGSASCNLLASDNSKILAMECLADKLLVKNVRTYSVKSNTYTSPSLQKFLLDQYYSKRRQNYAEKRLLEAFNKKMGLLTDLDLLNVMSDNPIVCRKELLKPKTLAYLTDKYFGIGIPGKKEPGIVPIRN